MITATRPDHSITRNAEHFKYYSKIPANDIDFNSNEPNYDIQSNTTDNYDNEENRNQVRHSGRNRRPPEYIFEHYED